MSGNHTKKAVNKLLSDWKQQGRSRHFVPYHVQKRSEAKRQFHNALMQQMETNRERRQMGLDAIVQQLHLNKAPAGTNNLSSPDMNNNRVRWIRTEARLQRKPNKQKRTPTRRAMTAAGLGLLAALGGASRMRGSAQPGVGLTKWVPRSTNWPPPTSRAVYNRDYTKRYKALPRGRYIDKRIATKPKALPGRALPSRALVNGVKQLPTSYFDQLIMAENEWNKNASKIALKPTSEPPPRSRSWRNAWSQLAATGLAGAGLATFLRKRPARGRTPNRVLPNHTPSNRPVNLSLAMTKHRQINQPVKTEPNRARVNLPVDKAASIRPPSPPTPGPLHNRGGPKSTPPPPPASLLLRRKPQGGNPFIAVAQFLKDANSAPKTSNTGLKGDHVNRMMYLAAQYAFDTFLKTKGVSKWVQNMINEIRGSKLSSETGRWNHQLQLVLAGVRGSTPLIDKVFGNSNYHRLQLDEHSGQLVRGRNVAEMEALQGTLRQAHSLVMKVVKDMHGNVWNGQQPSKIAKDALKALIKQQYDSYPRIANVLNTKNRKSVPADIHKMYVKGVERLEKEYSKARDVYIADVQRLGNKVQAKVQAKENSGSPAPPEVHNAMTLLKTELKKFENTPLEEAKDGYGHYFDKITHILRDLGGGSASVGKMKWEIDRLDDELKQTKKAYAKWIRYLNALTKEGLQEKLPLLNDYNANTVNAKHLLSEYVSRPMWANKVQQSNN